MKYFALIFALFITVPAFSQNKNTPKQLLEYPVAQITGLLQICGGDTMFGVRQVVLRDVWKRKETTFLTMRHEQPGQANTDLWKNIRLAVSQDSAAIEVAFKIFDYGTTQDEMRTAPLINHFTFGVNAKIVNGILVVFCSEIPDWAFDDVAEGPFGRSAANAPKPQPAHQ